MNDILKSKLKEYSLKKYIVLLALVHLQAFADSDLSRVEELGNLPIEELLQVSITTTIATGTKKTIAEAPAIASVITAAEIQAMGARNFEEALETIPGVHVEYSGFNMAPKYLIRGFNTSNNAEVLVLINGVPVTSAVRGDRNIHGGVLPISMISKIEVVRGPGSALYGSEAMSGVINVVTKSADEIKETTVGIRAGSFNSREGWVLTGFTHEDFKFSMMANYSQTDGDKGIITQDAATPFGTSLAPGPVNRFGRGQDIYLDVEQGHWRFQGGYRSVSKGSGAGTTDALDPIGRYSVYRETLNLTYHNNKIEEDWDFTSKIDFLHSQQESDSIGVMLFPPGTNLGTAGGPFINGMIGKPEYQESALHFETIGVYTGFESHILRLGVGVKTQRLYQVRESKNFDPNFGNIGSMTDVSGTNLAWLPSKTRNNLYSYVQDEWDFRKSWNLTTGVRYDTFSKFGSVVNPRAAVVWQTTPQLTSKLMFGKSFRSPNFVELYSQNNPAIIGNPNLKPETNSVSEIAFSYEVSKSLNLGFNLFHYQARNIISIVKGHVANAANEDGNGLELESQFKVSSNLYLTGNYSYLKTRDLATDTKAPLYPTQQAYLREEYQFATNWNFNMQAKYVGSQPRAFGDTRPELKRSTTLDLIILKKKVFGDWMIGGTIKNLFNEDIRAGDLVTNALGAPAIPNDLPLERRSYWLEVSGSF